MLCLTLYIPHSPQLRSTHIIPHFSIQLSNKCPGFCMISGFCHNVNEIYALFGFYAPRNVILLVTFPDNISVSPPAVKWSDTNARNT